METEPKIINDYVATGKVQYIYHYYALGEAQVLLEEAGHCAADQGHFWAYNKLMFENQDSTISRALRGRAGMGGRNGSACPAVFLLVAGHDIGNPDTQLVEKHHRCGN